MKKHRTILFVLIGCASAAWSMGASGADIYCFEDTDGALHCASQRPDASYRLYLRGEPRPANARRAIGGASPTRAVDTTTALLVTQLSRKHGIDPDLVAAVIAVESNGNPAALSAKGAAGLMQLMPATAAMYGITSPASVEQNVEAGIRHLSYLLQRHHGNVALTLAAYNAGEGAVARHHARIPPYRETMLYVPAVLARMKSPQPASR